VALQRPEPLALKEVSDPSLLTGSICRADRSGTSRR